MNIKLLFVLLLSLFLNIAKADLGYPTIQSVCKITLTNGKTIEGLITIGYGDYFGNWMNGFYLESKPYKDLPKIIDYQYFTLNFKSFTRTDSSYSFVKLELIEHPAQRWLDMISVTNKKAMELYNPYGSGDFVKVFWYHEIRSNKEQLESIQQWILFNIDR